MHPGRVQIVDGERFGFNNMCYKESEVRRIAKVAFDIAMKRGKKVNTPPPRLPTKTLTSQR